MWLINTQTLELEEFLTSRIPVYAILSHRWHDEEASFDNFKAGKYDSEHDSYKKIRNFCSHVSSQAINYAWVDTCCIDKRSSAELSESINSMFKWYRAAKICCVYLSDVDDQAPDRESQLRQSQWFTRGWTLQELVAPSEVSFFSKTWELLGSKSDLIDIISSITRIPSGYLLGEIPLGDASIAQRMSWASHRSTSREEDMAYSLMGIFDVNMPLIYGEGYKAFLRLQKKIIKQTNDDSILAWGFGLGDADIPSPDYPQHSMLSDALARHPSYFAGCENIITCEDWEGRSSLPLEIRRNSLHIHAIEVPLKFSSVSKSLSEISWWSESSPIQEPDYQRVALNCRLKEDINHVVAIPAKVFNGQSCRIHKPGLALKCEDGIGFDRPSLISKESLHGKLRNDLRILMNKDKISEFFARDTITIQTSPAVKHTLENVDPKSDWLEGNIVTKERNNTTSLLFKANQEDAKDFYLFISKNSDHGRQPQLRLGLEKANIDTSKEYNNLKMGSQRIFAFLQKTPGIIPGSYTAYVSAIEVPMAKQTYPQLFKQFFFQDWLIAYIYFGFDMMLFASFLVLFLGTVFVAGFLSLVLQQVVLLLGQIHASRSLALFALFLIGRWNQTFKFQGA